VSDRPFVPPSRVSARMAGTRDEGTKGRDEGTTAPVPRSDEQDSSEKPTVIIHANEFRLPEVLSHIEAGRIVRVILPEQRPASE
jgi:hypothetical protein